MASVAGIPQLNLNGVLGGLNGVIHSPLGSASQATLPALRPQPPPLNPQALAQGFAFPKSASPYVPARSPDDSVALAAETNAAVGSIGG